MRRRDTRRYDIIAILAKKLEDEGYRVKIYTPDKDMLQLVSDNVLVINPMNWEVFTSERVREKFGVTPKKLADYLALVGDKIDNIQGVKGIGPKTAGKAHREVRRG
ncbi:MAG: 5'-3' exonuclease H3TH domain-containing protein [Aquificota bacterium]|nr:5'-3' exonuclease H3TH domain-containing protein [Aquificota bacterium]